jgi:hypothetical protein
MTIDGMNITKFRYCPAKLHWTFRFSLVHLCVRSSAADHWFTCCEDAAGGVSVSAQKQRAENSEDTLLRDFAGAEFSVPDDILGAIARGSGR